jgi:hypothetical protein
MPARVLGATDLAATLLDTMDFARKHLIGIDEKIFPASTKLQNRKSYTCEAHQ